MDASQILKEYALLSTGKSSFSEEQSLASDIDNDGKIDAADASKVLGYYAFLSSGGEDKGIKAWLK